MNIIEKYRIKKEEKKPINIILNSHYDYKDHELNVMKECLNICSKTGRYIPLSYEWIYTNPDQDEKMYFITTNLAELKRMKLERLADKHDLQDCSYMNSVVSHALFMPDYTKVA